MINSGPAAQKTQQNATRSVLLTPTATTRVRTILSKRGINVITWPTLKIGPPKSFELLDQAIENLYGYDWIIFMSEASVRYFFERFQRSGRDKRELGSAKLCAIGDAIDAIQKRRVALHSIPRDTRVASVIEDLQYVTGESESLSRLNFLIPQAAIGRNYLKPALEKCGARVDIVPAYETVDPAEALRLVALQTLLWSGEIDCVALSRPADVREFPALFDTFDFLRLTEAGETEFCCANERTSDALLNSGMGVGHVSEALESNARSFAHAIA